jgi:hypothetical protein
MQGLLPATAITFDQLIAYAKTQIGNSFGGASPQIVNDMPFQFRYQNRTIIQENPIAFRVCNLTYNIKFSQGQLLVTQGEATTIVVDNPNPTGS